MGVPPIPGSAMGGPPIHRRARLAPRTRLSYAWWRYGRYNFRAVGQSVGYPEGSRPLVASFLPYPAGTPRA